jgi:pilus assembly protein CpaF
MVAMANLNLPDRAIRQQLASAFNAIIQVARLPDGTRRVMSISEVTGMEGEVILLQDLFVFERRGLKADGKVRGAFRAAGIRPVFSDRLAAAGFRLRSELFEGVVEV